MFGYRNNGDGYNDNGCSIPLHTYTAEGAGFILHRYNIIIILTRPRCTMIIFNIIIMSETRSTHARI